MITLMGNQENRTLSRVGGSSARDPPTLGWRVGHLGCLTSPFPLLTPSNRVRGGGPRQVPKGGTLSHLAYWNLLHKILHPPPHPSFFRVFALSAPNAPGAPDALNPPAPPQMPARAYRVCTAFYEAARSEAACFHVVHILSRNILDWHAPTLP